MVLPAATDSRPPTDRLELVRNVDDGRAKDASPATLSVVEVTSIEPLPLAASEPPTATEDPLDIEKDPVPD
jgi:hypothetical protein